MSQMPNLITIDESIDISDITETLDEIILNVIKTLRKNHKRPDECSIYDLIAKSLGNIKLTKDHIEERLRIMILSGTLENKEHNGKNSFFIKEKINLDPRNIYQRGISNPRKPIVVNLRRSGKSK